MTLSGYLFWPDINSVVFMMNIVPLLLQGYEDWLRHKADREVNNTSAKVLRGSKIEEIKSMHIKVSV